MYDAKKLNRKKAAVRKELDSLRKQEARLMKAASQSRDAGFSSRLEEKIPSKVQETLEKAFCRAFGIVFEKGTRIIEKGIRRESMQEDHAIQNYAAELRGTRRELRKMQKSAELAGLRDMAVTTVEGVGLGVLGIGLPDIVLFISVLLKSVYETALRYGFDYDSPREQMFILKLLEGSVIKGREWECLNAEIDGFLERGEEMASDEKALKAQIERTANAFAADMLLLKFIQGLPVVGMIGGMGNPVYYHKVMKYAGLKYRKRYLCGLERRCQEEERKQI